MKHPFAVPTRLPDDLTQVRAYWRSLLRGSAAMPFWDDLALTALPGLAGRLLLIDVFERPERFRCNTVGGDIVTTAVEGEFLDELRLASPFEFLRAQCSATVEAAAPTAFRREASGSSTATSKGYARLLLPMWGEGHVGMLLGVVAFD